VRYQAALHSEPIDNFQLRAGTVFQQIVKILS
jgi:hypothetical protein